MRTRVYVDGFNLYYGALKDTPFKWLNLVELTRRLLPASHAVDKLNYFTARVSGVSDPGAPAPSTLLFECARDIARSTGAFRKISCQDGLASTH